MQRILWLCPQKAYTDKERFALEKTLAKQRINPASVFYMRLAQKIPTIFVQKGKTEKSRYIDPELRRKALDALRVYTNNIKPKLIVCNDETTLAAITGSILSLNVARGSVYYFDNIPVLVVDHLYMTYRTKEGPFIFTNDLQKIWRWYNDKQRCEPKFTYSVCTTISEVCEAFAWLRRSVACAIDIETKGRFITCIGYCGVVDGKIHSYVVPFFNPQKLGNCHWEDEHDEIEIWKEVREFHRTEVIKIMQNGSYDSAYFIKYGVPTSHYYIDTSHLVHSLWVEGEKKLNYISSICLDFCRYWKDEHKGSKEDSFGKTQESLEQYWRYNALDCYNTLLNARVLCSLVGGVPWAKNNYIREFLDQIGPALTCTMTGWKVDEDRQRQRAEINQRKHEERLAELRIIADDLSWTPTPANVAELLYDILKAEPIKLRGKAATDKNGELKDTSRSTDEKVLKRIAEQHPLFDWVISKIWDCKKPAANISKYGPYTHRPNSKGEWKPNGLELVNSRFLSGFGAGVTETERWGSQQHPFWCGTNLQNVPANDREMCVADPGYVIFEADYSQSDARFIFYHANDPAGIANMESGKDTHSIHAAHFFKKTYEAIYTAAQNDEEWATHPTKGIRQNTKRIVHGTNFRMKPYTLYQQMGREATVAAAKALGFDDAGKWTEKELVSFCGKLQGEYFTMYTRLQPWFQEVVDLCVRSGNKATSAFGYTRLFFGNVASDENIQRELTAFYGQAGTAGNVRRVLREIYYQSDLLQKGAMLIQQTHDSICMLFPIPHMHSMAKQVLTIMEKKFRIGDHILSIPADAKIGLSWGKGLMKYKPDLTIEKIVEFENKFAAKYQRAA